MDKKPNSLSIYINGERYIYIYAYIYIYIYAYIYNVYCSNTKLLLSVLSTFEWAPPPTAQVAEVKWVPWALFWVNTLFGNYG